MGAPHCNINEWQYTQAKCHDVNDLHIYIYIHNQIWYVNDCESVDAMCIYIYIMIWFKIIESYIYIICESQVNTIQCTNHMNIHAG